MAEQNHIKQAIYDVIFGFESKPGKLFDIALICLILSSVAAVFIDSIAEYQMRYGILLYRLEWFFTIVFTIEYLLRIYSYPKRSHYVFSFYGIIDLVSILPTYIAFVYPAAAYMIVIRILRVLRIFRILKLFRYIGEANLLFAALYNARRKILVFLFSLSTLIVIFGALMFVVEGPEHGFNSIPVSIYWAIVTVTTVGYGDISPHTPFGQFIAAIAMICGYAVIAVPTGIVGAEIMQEANRERLSRARICPGCRKMEHAADAVYCNQCGTKL
ncbi:MAG TPA: ion transporter [Pseudomonadales bacterium]|nr:ion transporter [Pseudomonadales bacterium]